GSTGPNPHPAIAWSDPQRALAFHAWLAEITPHHGLVPASLELASADASFRRYLRIATEDGGSRIVMDAPPDKENSAPFVRIAALMQGAGLAVPEVLEWQRDTGFLLLSDLGTRTMMEGIDRDDAQANAGRYGQA